MQIGFIKKGILKNKILIKTLKKIKKVCLLLLYMFNVSLLFSQSLEDEQLKLKLLDFFNGIISKDTTVDSLINNYGNPDLVVNKKSGYLDDEMITYSYENIGNFNFFYKTDEKKIYFWSVNLNSNFIDIIKCSNCYTNRR